MAASPSLRSDPAGDSVVNSARGLSSHAPEYAILAGIILLAAFLRFHAISAKSFWLDEGISFAIARLSWSQFVRKLWSYDLTMGLYLLLLRFWLTMGRSEAWIRGLSVLFSVATVPYMFFLGARLFGRRAGLVAALLLSINVYHVRYAQEARSYAMAAFLVVVATWLFARNMQEPSSARWGAYAIVCGLATFSHFFAAMVVPAHLLSLLLWRNDEIPWRKFGRSLVAFGVIISPIVVFALKDDPNRLFWVPPIQFSSLFSLGILFSGNYGQPLLVLDLLAIGAAALAASRASRQCGGTKDAWGYGLVCSWLFVPIAVTAVVSLKRPIFVPRYLSICMPALLLLVAAGISRLRRPILFLGLLGGICWCSILGDLNYYRIDFDMARQDWRGAATYVLDHSQPGDQIFFYYAAGEAPFDYYAWKENRSPPKLISPTSWPGVGDGKEPKPEDLVVVPGTDLRAASPVGHRVWLVVMPLDGGKREENTGKAIGQWLSSGRRQVDTRVFSPLLVALFDANADHFRPADRTSVNR